MAERKASPRELIVATVVLVAVAVGLAALMPYYNALRVSEPTAWGLEGKEDQTKAYVHCPDPSDHTGGGTVIFEISKVG